MNLLDGLQRSISSEALTDEKFRDMLCGWLGIIYISDSSKESIVAVITTAYMQGRRDGAAAAEYKPDGEE